MTRRRLSGVIAGVAAAGALWLYWQLQAPAALRVPAPWPGFVDVTVINPGRGRLEHQSIALRDDRVESMRLASAADARDVRARMFAKRYVLPGLIDLEVRPVPHVLYLEHLVGLLYLSGGVTTVREIGDGRGDRRATQAAIASDALVFPRLFTCGQAAGGDSPHCDRTPRDGHHVPLLVQLALGIGAAEGAPPEPFQVLLPPVFPALLWPAQLAYLQANTGGSLRDEMTRRAVAAHGARHAGVHLRLGTGSPGLYAAPGGSARLALEILIMLGLTREEAWEAATRAAGETLRMPQLGTIEQGAPADLLVLREDPTVNATAMNSLEAVVVRGRLYPVNELVRRIMDHARYENSLIVAAWRNLQVRWCLWRDRRSVVDSQLP